MSFNIAMITTMMRAKKNESVYNFRPAFVLYCELSVRCKNSTQLDMQLNLSWLGI